MTDLLMAILFIPMFVAAVGITNKVLLFILGLTKTNRRSHKRKRAVMFACPALSCNSNAIRRKAG